MDPPPKTKVDMFIGDTKRETTKENDVGFHFRVVSGRGSSMPRGRSEGLALMEEKGDDEGRRVLVNYEKSFVSRYLQRGTIMTSSNSTFSLWIKTQKTTPVPY